MDLLNKYFSQLIFTRVDEKETADGTRFAVYGAGVGGSFGDGNARYILLFVPAHLAVKTRARIYELPWENLQTRNLHYSYRLRKQTWSPSRDLPDITLQISQRTKTHSIYLSSNFPFEVLLLHDLRKKTQYQYHNRITMTAALETFSSVFNYKGPVEPMKYTRGPQPVISQEEFDDSFELIP